MKPKFDEIVNVKKIGTPEAGLNLGEIQMLVNKEGKKPANLDRDRVILFLVDEQNDFISPKGGLPVNGAVEDTERLCRFIYKFIYDLYQINCTFDWHNYLHIFFSNAWAYGKDCIGVDDKFHKAGEYVVPNTVITYEGIKNGEFKTTLPNVKKAINYVKNVDKSKLSSEKNTPDELRIWPYHCQESTWGAALEGELNNIRMYHDMVRNIKSKNYYKGSDIYSEQYGAIKTEYSDKDNIRLDILNDFEDPFLHRVYFAGQAKSHCALRTLEQIVEYYDDRPEIINKICVLEDCMSCIPGFEQATQEKFEELRKKGVHFVKSTEITEL